MGRRITATEGCELQKFPQPHERVLYLRCWFWGIMPNWPMPCPGTWVFHGILLVSDEGPTGFLSGVSAQEQRAKSAVTRERSFMAVWGGIGFLTAAE